MKGTVTLRFRGPGKKTPELPTIEGYHLIEPWRNTNSGNARWSFASKDGKDYFIKEFLSPVFPEKGVLSPAMEEAKRRICFAYFKKKRALYDRILDSATGNLVLIHQFFLCGTKYYITTDKIEQCNITAEKVVDVSEDKKHLLLKILAFSLAKLHDNNVVHADLKPTNVLIKLSETGKIVAKIIDFDGSYIEGEQPGPDEVQGDQIYFAPETCRYVFGEDVKLTTKVDVFACGLLFHLYLAGTLPEIPKGFDYVYEALLDGEDIRISPKVPEAYAKLIKSMLALNPEDRPNMTQVLNALKAMDAASEPPKPLPPEDEQTKATEKPPEKPEDKGKGSLWKKPSRSGF